MAITKPITTATKMPIIIVPFIQETNGMFKKFITLILEYKIKNIRNFKL